MDEKSMQHSFNMSSGAAISHAEERIAFLTTQLNQRDFSKLEPLFKKHMINLKLLWQESRQLQLKTNP